MEKKIVDVFKRDLRFFLPIILIVIASLAIVFATTAVVNNGNTNTAVIIVDDTNTATLNISINITGPTANFGEIYNITSVLINLSTSGKQLNFTDGSENHSAFIRNAALSHANISVSATNWSINWTNTTGILNATGGQTTVYLWFGVTPNGPVPVKSGNISVQLFRTNTSAANVTNATMLYNITLHVNDSFTINYVGRTNVSGVNLSQNYIPLHLNISGNQTLLNLTVKLYNSSGQIYYNTTNSTGAVVNGSGIEYNFSNLTDGTDLPDGVYTLEVFAQGANGDINNTANRTLRLDKTKPTVTLAKNSGTTENKVVVDVTVSDTGSGAKELCEIDNTNAVMTGNGTTAQTLTQSTLNCGTTHTYVVTCQDQAGNRGVSSSFSISTSACGTTSSTGGGTISTTVQTWTHTVVLSNEEFKGGTVKSLSQNERIRIKVANIAHHVGVLSVSDSTVKITVQSTPQEATMAVNDVRKFDLNEDSVYDVSVTLKSITEGKADLSIVSISESVTQEAEQAQDEAQKRAEELEQPPVPEAKKPIKTIIFVIVLVVLIAAIAAFFLIKRRR